MIEQAAGWRTIFAIAPANAPANTPFTALAQTDPFEVISDFLASPLLKLALAAMAAFVVAVWLALAYRTYAEAAERGSEPMVWGLIALIFPFAGALLYRLVRPRDYADEREARYMQASLLREDYEASRAGRRSLGAGEDPACAHCGCEMAPEHFYCAGCGRARRSPCPACGEALERSWSFCPACGGPRRAASGGEAPASPRRRVRAPESAAPESAAPDARERGERR